MNASHRLPVNPNLNQSYSVEYVVDLNANEKHSYLYAWLRNLLLNRLNGKRYVLAANEQFANQQNRRTLKDCLSLIQLA